MSSREFLPWIEKYRPRTLDDVVHQEDVVRVLKRSLNSSNLPHLLFYGPAGTGKTSTILAAARELFGPAGMKERVLELNASDERGINVVREKVKNFARLSVRQNLAPGYPNPPFKIIVLDEADSMTRDAQSALRRMMEKYSTVTRFCLICNYVSRIISPITSRCSKFRFKPLSHDSIVKKLSEICDKENLTISTNAIDTVVRISEGDLRKAITMVQSAQFTRKKGEEIQTKDVVSISTIVPPEVVTNIVSICRRSRTDPTSAYSHVDDAVTEVIAEGHPSQLVLSELLRQVVSNDTFDSLFKAELSMKIAKADLCLNDGANEYLQLMDIFCACSTLMRTHPPKDANDEDDTQMEDDVNMLDED